MTTGPRKLAAVSTAPPGAHGQWRSDVDPLALPPTDDLTAGQRKVLLGCLGLFADVGFAASSVRDIAAAAGMQSASLYNHFPSKDAMLVRLVQIGYDRHLDRLMTAVVNAPADPREQLRAAIREHVLVHCEYSRLALIVTHELRHVDDPAAVGLLSIRDRSTALTLEILRRGEEQRVFDLVSPRVVLTALASMGIDAARWFPYQADIAAEELADDYARLALRMVGAHE